MATRPRRARRDTAVLRVVVLLVGLLAGLLAAPATGSADQESRAGTTRFVVVDHNVERRTSAIDAALQRARRTRAPVVLLQEVCWWQADAIREAHPQWTVAWKFDVESGRCRRRGLDGVADNGRAQSGNVAIWTGGSRGYVTSHTFRHQGSRDYRSNMVCISWAATGVVRRACSTHLVNAAKVTRRKGTQYRQAREVQRITRPWIRRGNFVVVGGDFNAGAFSRPMDLLYRESGSGLFHEATGCPPAAESCRRFLAPTFDGGKSKIDYVFFSANRFPPGTAHGLNLARTLSDHHLLTGWAYVDVSGPG